MDVNYLFWEDLPNESYVLDVADTSVYIAPPIISFHRDDNFRLLYKITTEIKSDRIFGNLAEIGLSPPFTARRLSDLFELRIDVASFVNLNTTPNINNQEYIINKHTLTGEVYNLELIVHGHTDTYCKYWFLNSDDNFYWNSATHIDKSFNLKIKIGGFEDSDVNINGGSNSSRDACALKINNKDFLFGKIDKKHTGSYGGSFIQSKVSAPLSDSEVETIRYLLSFISGTPLIPLGKTIYAANHMIAGKSFLSSERYDIGQLVANSKQRIIPASLNLQIEGVNWTEIINNLIAKYHSMKGIFPLDEVIENIHTYRILPLRLKIQPLATAFDLLCDAWFKSDLSTSKGKNLQDVNYSSIINKYMDDIKKDLGDSESSKAILNKIKSAHNMGMNQRINVFLDELGVELDDNERSIMHTRNKIVHGISGNIDYNDIFTKTHGYYSLLGKIILKILGYNFLYFDYSQVDYKGNPTIKIISNEHIDDGRGDSPQL